MYFVGIDVGSLSTETVIVDHTGTMVSYHISSTGANSRTAGEGSFAAALASGGIAQSDVNFTVATGYGRVSIPFADKTVTEITCHARGAVHLFPATQTIIDVGGQDSKVIRVSQDGKVADFNMNDKCAAGTGRFLEVMARALEIDLDRMGPLSLRSTCDVSISSMCTVFAESEVISLVARATPKEDILNAIHKSICNRLAPLMDAVGIRMEVTMTGGVAKNSGIVEKIREKVGQPINVPEEPQIVGALGAALIARDMSTHAQ
ncbi:MAG: acyl-CoA dehydratase activase [Thermodesulfobacteriota bacterium]